MKGDSKKLWIGVGVVALVAGGYALMPSDNPPLKKPGTTFGASSSTASAKPKEKPVYTKEDQDAQFDELASSKRNAFKPVVEKKTGVRAGNSSLPNAVPAMFAGGDSGWVYTGTMVIDNSPSALMENKAKAEALYVRIGEKWLTSSIARITSTTVELVGPNGRRKVLDLLADPPEGAKGAATYASNAPRANSGGQGGLPAANMAMDPMMGQGGAAMTMPGMDDGTMQFQSGGQGGGRNRGGGRGNRGNRGGGGFGGSDVTGSATFSAPVSAAPSGTIVVQPIGGFQPDTGDDNTANLPNTPAG